MDCLDNFIGIRTCPGDEAPRSGHYIDDLEGITLSHAADIATDTDAIGLIREKIRFAARQTVADALAFLPHVQPAHKEGLRAACFSGAIVDSRPSLEIARNPHTAPLSRLLLKRVFLKVSAGGAGTVDIYDGDNIVWQVPVVLAANVEYTVEGLALEIEGKLTIRIETDGLMPWIAPRTSQYWTGAATSCCSARWQSPWLSMTDGVGIAADVAVECSTERLECRLLPILKDAVLYRAGIELLNEHLASDRANFFATGGQEWAAQKRTEWAGIYEAKLRFACNSGLAKSLIKEDPHCFDCGGNKFGYSI